MIKENYADYTDSHFHLHSTETEFCLRHAGCGARSVRYTWAAARVWNDIHTLHSSQLGSTQMFVVLSQQSFYTMLQYSSNIQ